MQVMDIFGAVCLDEYADLRGPGAAASGRVLPPPPASCREGTGGKAVRDADHSSPSSSEIK
jgi:hypothetical protein